MNLRRQAAAVAVALLAFTSIAGAQDTPEAEPSAFLQMLAHIPDTADIRASIPVVSFADYHAALEARGIAIPTDWAAMEAANPRLVLFSLPPAGPSNLLQYLMVGGAEYQTLLGFEFFDIAQAAEIGTPPPFGYILHGEIDPVAVTAAYEARGYTVDTTPSGVLLCPPAGCDEGFRLNLSERNPANPFGGNLGRSELSFVAEDVLFNSPDDQLIAVMTATVSSDTPALADAPEFQALDAALAGYPFVSAVIAVTPATLIDFDVINFATGDLLEQIETTMAENPLPPYLLASFASASTTDAELGLALFVYPDAESATAAAAAIDARMALPSNRLPVPYAEVYGDVGTLEAARVFTDEATGLSVVILQITSEIPAIEGEDGRPVMSHRPFQRIIQGIYARDALWLVADRPE